MDRVLIDTSAWIEFFRKREPYHGLVSSLTDSDQACCIGLIYAELLRGAKGEKEVAVLRELPHVLDFLDEEMSCWEEAGLLSFRMQRKGKRIGLADCYVAAIALRYGVSLLTLDSHFAALSQETGLKLLKPN